MATTTALPAPEDKNTTHGAPATPLDAAAEHEALMSDLTMQERANAVKQKITKMENALVDAQIRRAAETVAAMSKI